MTEKVRCIGCHFFDSERCYIRPQIVIRLGTDIACLEYVERNEEDESVNLEILFESKGVEMIMQERARQMSEEGYDEKHDRIHECSELVRAAKAYLRAYLSTDGGKAAVAEDWPWEIEGFKPSTRGVVGNVRDLEKAGALIAAHIDHLNAIGLLDK